MSTDPTSQSSDSVDRRDFVKTSAAAAVGMTAFGVHPFAMPSYSYDDTIRVGLIGCGGRGTGAAVQALNARANVKLVAMAD
jgi:myo-inositol 2-dehydrogenase/D-chiro-inositol 1-dehydrogenase